MEQGTSAVSEAASSGTVKLCECGCGQPAPIATHTNSRRGAVKGQPQRFVIGHYARFAAAQRPAEVPPEDKFCECGCGEPAPVATYTNKKRGYVRGQRVRFARGHQRPRAKAARVSTPPAPESRRAAGATAARGRTADIPPVQPKLCECGCGGYAPLARQTNAAKGYVQGQPVPFISGHGIKLRMAESALMAEFSAASEETALSASLAEAGLCGCGCGEPAPIASKTVKSRGWVKGQPLKFIAGHHLRNKTWTSGNRRKYNVRDGQRIGSSIVVGPEFKIPSPNGKVLDRVARLRCECGTEYVRKLTVIFGRDPANESCGCGSGRYADRAGQKFGRLTAISRVDVHAPKAGGTVRWLCRCDCGKEVTVSGTSLTRGRTLSCGCLKEGPQQGLGFGGAALNAVLHTYKGGARRRGYSFDLTRDEFRRLTSLDCHYCGLPPSTVKKGKPKCGDYVYNGIDRVDNRQGYHEGNVVPCCEGCNRLKGSMSLEAWMTWGIRFATHLLSHPEVVPEHLRPPQLRTA